MLLLHCQWHAWLSREYCCPLRSQPLPFQKQHNRIYWSSSTNCKTCTLVSNVYCYKSLDTTACQVMPHSKIPRAVTAPRRKKLCSLATGELAVDGAIQRASCSSWPTGSLGTLLQVSSVSISLRLRSSSAMVLTILTGSLQFRASY